MLPASPAHSSALSMSLRACFAFIGRFLWLFISFNSPRSHRVIESCRPWMRAIQRPAVHNCAATPFAELYPNLILDSLLSHSARGPLRRLGVAFDPGQILARV